MKTVHIFEEKNIVSSLIQSFQQNFNDWSIKIQSSPLISLFNTSSVWENGQAILLVEFPNDLEQTHQMNLLFRELDENVKIIFFAHLSKLKKEIADNLFNLSRDFTQILSIVDLDSPFPAHFPSLRLNLNLLCSPQNDSLDMDILLELKREIDHVAITVEKELQKVKKLHEHIIPKRFSEIKGINILSKYAVGEHSGGEFFDLLYKNKKIGLLLSSSASYVISGVLLTHFSNLKKEKSFDMIDVKKFICELGPEIQNISPKFSGTAPLQLFIAIIDLKTLTVEGYNFGQTLLLSSLGQNISGNQNPLHESFLEKSYFQFKVKRGEKMILLSPGIRKNTKDLIDGRPLIRYIQKQFAGTPFEILNELFFQLKRDKESDFLPYDASSIIIEVNRNVLVQA